MRVGRGFSSARMSGMSRAKKRGMTKFLSSGKLSKRSSNTSTTRTDTSSVSKASKSSSTKSTKEIENYQEMKDAATSMRNATTTLISIGLYSTVNKESTKEEETKEILTQVKSVVEKFNVICEDIDNLSGTNKTYFKRMMAELVSGKDKTFAEAGLSVDSKGKIKIEEKKLESVDHDTLKEIFCSSKGFIGEVRDQCKVIENYTDTTLRTLNKLYGNNSIYNKYGLSSDGSSLANSYSSWV